MSNLISNIYKDRHYNTPSFLQGHIAAICSTYPLLHLGPTCKAFGVLSGQSPTYALEWVSSPIGLVFCIFIY